MRNRLIAVLVHVLLYSLINSQSLNPFEGCFYVPGSVCIDSQKAMIAKDNRPENLIGYWTFDDKYAADHSGFRNFAKPAPKVGPAAGGKGYSAYYNGTDMSIIDHIPTYETSEFTLSFWVFLLQGNLEGWRSIIYKGNSSKELTPNILLWPGDTRLHVRVSTDKVWSESLDSVGAIPLRKWTHVTVAYSNQLLQLFLDGMLDSQVILQGTIMSNQGPFYVGKDPYHAGTACFIDNIKFYEGKLKETWLMAEASSPLYVIDGAFYTVVGCDSCNYNEALNSCPEEYHLCSLPELYSGGYHNARTLGWFRNNKDVWFRVSDQTQSQTVGEEMLDPNIFKLGICCRI